MYSNRIIVDKVTTKANRIEVTYCIEGERLIPCFRGLHPDHNGQSGTFYAEYSENIEGIPAGIAVVPFVANVLPIVWLLDAELVLDELDENFYECLPEIEHGYILMYPMLSFGGKVTVKKLSKYHSAVPAQINHTATLFSGGVDAFATLFAHYDERPALITLWGSDIKLEDEEGWAKVWEHVTTTSESLNLPTPIWIKTNFRTIVNEGYLDKLVEKSGDAWWHGFQHGIGISAHIAPLSYIHGFATIYMASSYTVRYKGPCASDPILESHLRFADCCIRHDRYSYNRNDKINLIVRSAQSLNVKISLHVCWQSAGGENCCHCEKCLRTIMGIISQGGNPNDFGLNFDVEALPSYAPMIKTTMSLMPQICHEWKLIQEAFKSRNLYPADQRYNWIYTLEADKYLLTKTRIKNLLRIPLFPIVYLRRRIRRR